MIFFGNINPLMKILMGNLLLLICCLFYLVWWIIVFRPNPIRQTSGNIYVTIAFLTGIGSILCMFYGVIDLSQAPLIFPITFILLGGIMIFIILITLTTRVFHRPVTSELFIIHIWAISELSMIDVLFSNGHLCFTGALIYLILIGISIIASLLCYVLYYRLDEPARYKAGMVPLVLAIICALAFFVVNSTTIC